MSTGALAVRRRPYSGAEAAFSKIRPFRTDLLYQVMLTLDEINMLLFILQDVQQQIPRYEVANALAVSDGLTQIVEGSLLQTQIGTQDFFHGLANGYLVQPLNIGQPIQEQNALNRHVSVLHLLDRFGVLMLSQLCHAPMIQCARMQKILIDGRQFIGEHAI